MHCAAGRTRLALEPHQEVEHLARVRAAIDEVAEAHEVGIAALPAQSAIDDALCAQQRRERVIGAVHVGEGDDAAGAFDAIRGIRARRAARRAPRWRRQARGKRRPGQSVRAWGVSCARHGGAGQRMTTRAGKMMLQGSPLFRGLPPATLERMAALATQRGYRRGEIVFSAGDAGDALFGVVSGRIRISTGNADGREIFLNIMEPGDTFGEIALLDGGTRTATATAIEAAELVSIRREPFFELLEREPKAALELLRLCGERLRWTSGLLEDAAFLDAPARLAKRLLSLGELHGEDSAGGRMVRISQEELASFLGVSRQSVNEQLQDWKAKGWVALGRGTVTVRDAAALRRAISAVR